MKWTQLTDHKIIKGMLFMLLRVSFVHFISHCQHSNIYLDDDYTWHTWTVQKMEIDFFAIRLHCLLHVHKLVHKTTNNLWISSSLHSTHTYIASYFTTSKITPLCHNGREEKLVLPNKFVKTTCFFS